MLAVIGFNNLHGRPHVGAQGVHAHPCSQGSYGVEVPQAVERVLLALAVMCDTRLFEDSIKLVCQRDDGSTRGHDEEPFVGLGARPARDDALNELSCIGSGV